MLITQCGAADCMQRERERDFLTSDTLDIRVGTIFCGARREGRRTATIYHAGTHYEKNCKQSQPFSALFTVVMP